MDLFPSSDEGRKTCNLLGPLERARCLQSQYILSLLVFVIINKSYFIYKSDIHDINTHTIIYICCSQF
jgi:hypothetical protein